MDTCERREGDPDPARVKESSYTRDERCLLVFMFLHSTSIRK
jgi:hypothetical protein